MAISCYMKLKSRYKKYKLALTFMLAIGSLFFYISAPLAPSSILNCLDSQANVSNKHNITHCTNNYLANKNWLVWLTGGSRSAYFQYLDLLELLNPR